MSSSTAQNLIARFALTAAQAETVIEAVKVVISSDCWKSDTQLEDMIDALAWELRDYEYDRAERLLAASTAEDEDREKEAA